MNKDKKGNADMKKSKKASGMFETDLEADEIMSEDNEAVVEEIDVEEIDVEEIDAYCGDDGMDLVFPVEKKKYRLTKRYYCISLAVMILAALVFVLFGPAPSVENIGGKVYTATLANHFPENRIDEIKAEIVDIVGFDVDVKLDTSLLTGMQVLEVRVKAGQRISQYLVRERLHEKFPYMKLGSFSASEYSPMLTIDNLITYSIVLGLAFIAMYIISGILLGGKNGSRVVFAALHDVLLIFSLYILLRVPNPRLLIVAALVVLIASPYLNITKIETLEKNKDSAKKRKAVDAVTDVLAYEKSRNINFVISVGILAVATVVVGIVMSAGMIMWFGGAFAVAIGVAIYSTTAFVPNMWGIAEQSRKIKASPKNNKKSDAKNKKRKSKKNKK